MPAADDASLPPWSLDWSSDDDDERAAAALSVEDPLVRGRVAAVAENSAARARRWEKDAQRKMIHRANKKH